MKIINLEKYNKILFCGIGGSAIPGEIIKAINLKKPVLTAREILPNCVDTKTLCFIISYSGDTAETIKLYKQAKKRNCKIIIITSGGKLSKINEEIFLVEKGHVPREALVYMLKHILKILNIKSRNLEKLIKEIDNFYAKKIANQIKNNFLIVYASSESLKIISRTWQTLFEENAKILIHSNYFPELAHNEIESRIKEKHKFILLLDKETIQIKKAKKIIKNPIEIKLMGKNLLEKIIYGIYLGNSISKEIATINKINYKENKRIDSLK